MTVAQLEAVSQNTATAKATQSEREPVHPSAISVTIVSLSARTPPTAGRACDVLLCRRSPLQPRRRSIVQRNIMGFPTLVKKFSLL